jgi:hypothetical protein
MMMTTDVAHNENWELFHYIKELIYVHILTYI